MPTALVVAATQPNMDPMARPKSDEKRQAILAAAAQVVAAEGLAASTARIAQAAGVATGSLFTYFESKEVLFNQLYLSLKTELIGSIIIAFPEDTSLRERFSLLCSRWLTRTTDFPAERLALQRLGSFEGLTPETRSATMQIAAGFVTLVREVSKDGPLRGCPPAFISGMIEAMLANTAEFMRRDPPQAEMYRQAGLESLWKAIAAG